MRPGPKLRRSAPPEPPRRFRGDGLGVPGLHVHLGGPLHVHEASHRLLHAIAHGEQAVIAQDDGSIVTEGCGDALAALHVLNLHFLVVEDRVIFEEHAGLLGDGLDGSHLGGEGRPPLGVDMSGAHGVGTRGQDGLVDVVTGDVDPALPFHQLPVGIHQHHVAHAGRVKGNPEAEHPETVQALGIPGADVAVADVPPTAGGEDPIPQGQHALPVFANRDGRKPLRMRRGVQSLGHACASTWKSRPAARTQAGRVNGDLGSSGRVRARVGSGAVMELRRGGLP